MIGVPQLCGNKNVFARDPRSSKSCLQRLAYLALVPVPLSTIEVSESSFQCVPRCSYRHGGVGNQGAKAECGHMATSIVERHSRHTKIRSFNQGNTSALLCVLHHRGFDNLCERRLPALPLPQSSAFTNQCAGGWAN
jgi:hypothetical protein